MTHSDPTTARRCVQRYLETTTELAVVVTDADGTIIGWLGAAERLFGYSSAEAIGMNLGRTYSPEDVDRGLDLHERQLALSAGRAENDRWHVRKDGSRFWSSGVLESVRDEAGDLIAFCKVLRDRTDIRSQIEALQNRAAVCLRDDKLRRDAVLSLTHELRNAVAPIRNALHLLDIGGDSQKVRERLHRNLSALAALLEDLSESATREPRRMHLERRRIDVVELVQQVALDHSAVMSSRSQDLKVTVPSSAIEIDADAVRLNQVLVNLLANASKYTPRGGSIQVSVTVETDSAVVRVEDTGIGIAGDVLPHIFELFTREHHEDDPGGHGVGLAIVQQYVHAHGGVVEARSPGTGKGSVFVVRLPLPVADQEPRSTAPPASEPEGPD